jgi:hypothetical protein
MRIAFLTEGERKMLSGKQFSRLLSATVLWLSLSATAQAIAEEQVGVCALTDPVAEARQHAHCVSYNYPFIVWLGKRANSLRNADAFLSTTFEGGMLRYSITLQPHDKAIYHLASCKPDRSGIAIEMLDENGFKLTEFVIPGCDFHRIAGSPNMEARGDMPMYEEIYQRTQNIEIH